MSNISRDSLVIKAKSPSSKYVTWFVIGANAIASEPTNISPFPWPIAKGEPFLAAINKLSLSWNKKHNAYAPSNRSNVFFAAIAGLSPLLMKLMHSWATVSVSVSD